MIEIQNNKILLVGKELQFDHKIIEAAEVNLENGEIISKDIVR